MTTPGADLGRYLATLRRWWLLAVAIVGVAAVAGYAVARLSPTSYAATAKVLLDQDRHVDSLLGTTGYAPDPERELNTGVLLITAGPIAADVRRSLGVRESAAELAAAVSTATDRNSNIVSITAADADPERAARIANAFAAAYRGYRADATRRSVDEALGAARARRSVLADDSERRELDAQVRRLQAIAAFDTGGVTIVDRATAAAATVSPRPAMSAFVAALLGFVLAGVAIVVLTRTDPKVRDERDLERLAGRPVTALVRCRADAREALLPVAVSLRQPVVLLTSPGAGEGAPEVALALARAIALTGRSAIAIDASGEYASFGGEDRLDDALVPLVGPGDGDAWALPAGSSDLPRVTALVQAAGEQADVVLLSGPPALVGLASEVLLVARLHETRSDELTRAVRALTAAGAPPAGVVATLAPASGALRGALARLRPASAWRRPSPGHPDTTPEVTVG